MGKGGGRRGRKGMGSGGREERRGEKKKGRRKKKGEEKEGREEEHTSPVPVFSTMQGPKVVCIDISIENKPLVDNLILGHGFLP